MGPGVLPKGLLGPWAPRASLGALLVRSWLLLGPLGPLLGPPEQLLGLILASRAALFVAFGVPVFERPWKKAKTLIFVDSSSLFEFF